MVGPLQSFRDTYAYSYDFYNGKPNVSLETNESLFTLPNNEIIRHYSRDNHHIFFPRKMFRHNKMNGITKIFVMHTSVKLRKKSKSCLNFLRKRNL